MKIVYTKHALYKINKKKLALEWIEETIKHPNFTNIEGHKYYAIKKLNGITVKVVYTRERYIKVITCFIIK